jgi:predicted acylesterase/phospholipase RssA
MTSTIGLVLGAGGMSGQAYHAGALAALAHDTGWDPRTADVVVGTSAGAVTGALLRGDVEEQLDFLEPLLPTWPVDALRVCAVRRRDGHRVVFRDGRQSPRRAVAASCAVPGYLTCAR